MMTRTGRRLIMAALLVAPPSVARAEEAAPVPSVAQMVSEMETKQAERIERLIRHLGAPEVRRRDRAVEDLQVIGRSAVPRLQVALASEDPEIAARAAYLLDRLRVAADGRAARFIASRYQAGTPRVESHWNPGPGMNEVHSLDPSGDCKVIMRRDAHWITLILTCRTPEGNLKEEYRARNEEELKTNHPIVWGIHEAIAESLGWEPQRRWWRQWENTGSGRAPTHTSERD